MRTTSEKSTNVMDERDPDTMVALLTPHRCDERLQTKTMEVTLLSYTGLAVELEHLKIETRLTIERFASVMGEYVTER
jgi:hypothetical protein